MEPYLGNPVRCEAVLRQYGFVFHKKFGQNFLIDAGVLEGTAEASEIQPDDVVLEIGPGIGSLTQYLASRAKKVIAVEIDKTLIPILEDTLSGWNNAVILNQDILKTDLQKIADEENEGRPLKVAANLPYYITTPIIMKLFESGAPVDTVTVMVQREVADRIETGPGSKNYGALSLAVQYYAKPERIMEVEPTSFVPRPNVGSTVIRLKRFEHPPVQADDEKMMFRLIRATFNQRRKTLVNSIANFEGLSFPKEAVQKAIAECGFRPDVRGETLTLAQFAELSNAFSRILA